MSLIKCGSTKLNSKRVGIIEKDGYFDMHHTCIYCNSHFDHLEGITFEACDVCNYKTN